MAGTKATSARILSGSSRTIKSLEARTGGLSNPGKMPGFGYSIPADACQVGALLRDIPGSTCSSCYARKGRYVFPTVRAAMRRRLRAVLDSPTWVEDMVALLELRYRGKRARERFFRWHDSGDLQNLEHLRSIVEVARQTPRIRHWLPTREVALVREYLETGGTFPEDLTVRLSAAMVGQPGPDLYGLPRSSVENPAAFPCRSRARGGRCGPCRACWDSSVSDVGYLLH